MSNLSNTIIKILMLMLNECSDLVIENDMYHIVRDKIQPMLLKLTSADLEEFFEQCKQYKSILGVIDMDEIFLVRNCPVLCQYMLNNLSDFLDINDLEDKLTPCDIDEVNTNNLWKLEMIQDYKHQDESTN